MNFSKLRQRIIFLKPTETIQNSMHENVPVWKPHKPTSKTDLDIREDEVYFKEDGNGNAVLVTVDDAYFAHELLLKEYAVWASVAPMTGREYEEAQKLRAETTYNIITRYFPNITTDMKILHRDRIFDIVSVLNTNERNVELHIVAKERDRNGTEGC